MEDQAVHDGKAAEAGTPEKVPEPLKPPAAAPIAYCQPQPGLPQPGYQQPGMQSPGYVPQLGVQQQGHPQSGAYPPAMSQYSPPPPGSYPAPVVMQPAQDMWMVDPQGIPNCPRGLEYLTVIDQLLVQQKMELLEVAIGIETNNKYVIKNSMGQKVYKAAEDNDFCTRAFCSSSRPFEMKIMDNAKNEIIHLHRPLACDGCCFPCCLQYIDVFAPPGHFIGRVKQNWSFWVPNFTIENEVGDTILKIEGPFCTFKCYGDVEFKVLALDGVTQVGKIAKQWTGFAKEAFTDADNFGITFPMDLDVRMKAVMLGAVFLVDFMYFEHSNNTDND